MKIYFLLFVGFMLCLSISGIRREAPRAMPGSMVEAIERDMDGKFALRDSFIDKSNRGHFVRTHEVFKRTEP